MDNFFKPSTYWNDLNRSFSMFGVGHIVIIALTAIAIVFVILLGKVSEKRIKKYLVIMLFVWTLLEIFKMILFFLTSGNSNQALREVLPLYMCSLFIYSLPLAIFCSGKLKQIGDYTLCTLCAISGLLTTVNCPVLYSYPFWSFYSLHSLLYHAAMAVTGVLLISSGYVKLEIKKFYYPLFLVTILAIFAIIMNNLVYTDYMLMRFAWGTPVLNIIAAKIGQVLQIILMFIIYGLLCIILTSLVVFINKKQAKHI